MKPQQTHVFEAEFMPYREREAFIVEAERQGAPIRHCPMSVPVYLIAHPDGTGLLVFASFNPWPRTRAHMRSSFVRSLDVRERFKVRRRPVPHAARLAAHMVKED